MVPQGFPDEAARHGPPGYTLLQQQLIVAQERLDRQVFRLTRLNHLSDQLLDRSRIGSVTEMFAEAVVDVLDVAVGAVWLLPPHDVADEHQVLVGARLPTEDVVRAGEALRAQLEAQPDSGSRDVTELLGELLPGRPFADAVACRCIDRSGRTAAVVLAANTPPIAGIVGPITDDTGEMLNLLGQKLSNHLDTAADQRLIDDHVARLEDSERRYRLLAENSSDFVLLANTDRVIEWVSPSITTVLGWTPDEVVGRRTYQFVHPDQHAALVPVWEKVDAGEAVTGRILSIRRDGSTRWLSRTLRPITDDEGKPLGHVAGFHDVQWEVEAEQELAASRERARRAHRLLRVALDSSPLPFAVFRVRRDEHGAINGFNVEFANERASGGTDPRAVIGLDLLQLFRGAREHGIEAALIAAADDPEPRALSIEMPDPIAGTRYYEAFVSRVDEHLVATSLIELTELRQAQAAAAEARDAAEAASRAKSDFLATVTHELRTPLTTMIGASELLLDGPLAAEQRDLVQHQRDASNMLLALVNDILDLSKIEAGKIELEWLDVDLRALLDHVVGMFAGATADKGLWLRYEMEPGTPQAFVGDPVRLKQILVNLVSNSVKFTAHGGIDVRVGPADTTVPGAVVLRFSVQDTGIGVPEEAQARIFDAFSQASTSTFRVFGGSGLGLSIAQRLVGLMGGRIDIDSAEGRGTTISFTATLRPAVIEPVGAVAREGHPAAPPQDGLGASVLLAEDNKVNRVLLSRMLQSIGCSVTTAVTGVEAVAAVEADDFDLVLMDLAMPDMDGFEATRRIRQHENGQAPHQRTPILALTANATRNVVDDAMAAGMDAFLSKPINLQDLRAAVGAYARRGGEPG